MLQRKITKKLIEWKNTKNKKALLVTGARQIGKTYAIREFGKSYYENFIEINFLETPTATMIFKEDYKPDEIILNISSFTKQKLVEKKTLIFFDEIQECPNARTAIKFLVADGRYDYIESGSLLGVNYKVVPSYPVGYESIITMYPMDFEEFAFANGLQESTYSYLEKSFENKTPINQTVHDSMKKLFYQYIVVGGMPEVVKTFVESHDLNQCIEIQQSIIKLYRQDITKYSQNNQAKITNIFDRIPAELNTKNKRFMLSDITKSARMERYESCFNWLNDAGITLPCYNIVEPKLPLKINEIHNLFKLYFNDVGLLCAASLENVQFDILQGNLSINMGSILENVFAQELVAKDYEIRYFDRKNIGEIDFIIQDGKNVIPLEIKSGKSFTSHQALNNLINSNFWELQTPIVFCQGNIDCTKEIIYMPWYMIIFLKKTKNIFPNLIEQIDLKNL